MGQPNFISGSTYIHRVLVTDKATGAAIDVTNATAVFTAVSCVDGMTITKSTENVGEIIKPTDPNNAFDVVFEPSDTENFTGDRTLDTQINITEQGGRVSKFKLTNLTIERG